MKKSDVNRIKNQGYKGRYKLPKNINRKMGIFSNVTEFI